MSSTIINFVKTTPPSQPYPPLTKKRKRINSQEIHFNQGKKAFEFIRRAHFPLLDGQDKREKWKRCLQSFLAAAEQGHDISMIFIYYLYKEKISLYYRNKHRFFEDFQCNEVDELEPTESMALSYLTRAADVHKNHNAMYELSYNLEYQKGIHWAAKLAETGDIRGIVWFSHTFIFTNENNEVTYLGHDYYDQKHDPQSTSTSTSALLGPLLPIMNDADLALYWLAKWLQISGPHDYIFLNQLQRFLRFYYDDQDKCVSIIRACVPKMYPDELCHLFG